MGGGESGPDKQSIRSGQRGMAAGSGKTDRVRRTLIMSPAKSTPLKGFPSAFMPFTVGIIT